MTASSSSNDRNKPSLDARDTVTRPNAGNEPKAERKLGDPISIHQLTPSFSLEAKQMRNQDPVSSNIFDPAQRRSSTKPGIAQEEKNYLIKSRLVGLL